MQRAIVDRADRFAASPAILSGMAPLDAKGELVAGDELLFGVRLEVRERHTVWYLRFRVERVETQRRLEFRCVEDFEDRARPDAKKRQEIAEAAARSCNIRSMEELATDMAVAQISVEALDAQGRRLESAESGVIESTLRRGLVPACVAGHGLRDVMKGRVALGNAAPMIELSGADYDKMIVAATGVESCRRFFQLFQKNPVTRRILFEVVALPSIWSMLRRLGVRAEFSIDFFAAQRVAAGRFAATPRQLWSVPMKILLNDEPALLVQLIVGPSEAPDGTAAGVFGLVGRHPTDPKRQVFVQLLASRRGEVAGTDRASGAVR